MFRLCQNYKFFIALNPCPEWQGLCKMARIVRTLRTYSFDRYERRIVYVLPSNISSCWKFKVRERLIIYCQYDGKY